MTRLFALLLSFFLYSATYAQQFERELITEAIVAGNSRVLATYFTQTVDLTVGKAAEAYSKEQAEVIINRFFIEHPPKAFSLRHEGKSKMDDHFFIGDLQTANAPYRVTIFMKREDGAFRIRQLRMELE